jgi:hypothetical protein
MSPLIAEHPVPVLDLPRALPAALLALAAACGHDATDPGDPPSGSPSIPLVQNVSIPAGGGQVVVSKPGDQFDGVRIDVPAGAFAGGSTWSLARDTSIHATLPAGYSQVGSALVVNSGKGFSDDFLTLTVPMAVSSDLAVAAFYVDVPTGKLELLPIAGRTDTKLIFRTSHFSGADLMVPANAPSPSRGALRGAPRFSASSAASSGFGQVPVIFVQVPVTQLDPPATTGFAPGTDDWEFSNAGSYASFGGYCAGSSITEMYWYYMLKPALGPLYHRYEGIVGFNDDDPQGIRLASAIQEKMAWNNVVSRLKALDDISGATGLSLDRLNYQNLVMALRTTGQPQLLAISNESFGHAVVAFASANGVVQFADPNEPGHARQITFANDVFQPFPFSSNVNDPPATMTTVRVVGVSAIVPEAKLQAEFVSFFGGTAGDDLFPVPYAEYRDSLNHVWEPLPDTLTTSVLHLRIRQSCQGCPAQRSGKGPADELYTQFIAPDGHGITGDFEPADSEVSVAVSGAGTKKYGVDTYGRRYADSMPAIIDFSWLVVRFETVSISPKPFEGYTDSTSQFSVAAGYLSGSETVYEWTFGDGGTATLTGNTNVSHVFAASGSYKIKVVLKNAVDDILGADSTTATITVAPTAPVSVWRIQTASATTVGSVPVNNGTPEATRALQLYTQQKAYWEGVAGGSTTTLWYLSQATTRAKGIYYATGLPASNPPLQLLADTGHTFSAGAADDPGFTYSFITSGTPPNDGVAAGTRFNTNFWCASDNVFTVTDAQSVTMTMQNHSASGTITFVYRVAVSGCAPYPRPETARWQLVVPFTAVRIQ